MRTWLGLRFLGYPAYRVSHGIDMSPISVHAYRRCP